MLFKTIANVHVTRFVESVFENRLIQNGFACPNDKKLCWYRVKNGEIVNSLVFFSLHSAFPIMLNAGYGIHPLFQKPVSVSSVVWPNRPFFEYETFQEQLLVENCPVNEMGYVQYSRDIRVMVPGRGGHGLYTFENIILPKMELATTIENCYQQHKENNRFRFPNVEFSGLTGVFIDEALFVDDSEMYPICLREIEKKLNYYQKCKEQYPHKKESEAEYDQWLQRKAAVMDGNRKEYLAELEKRKNKNTKLFHKWGIVF